MLLDVGENHVELLAPARARTRRSAASWPGAGPGLHHVAYQVADIEATLAAPARGGRAADRRDRRASASAARAWRSCTRRRPAASSPSSSNPLRSRHDGETSGDRLPGRAGALPAHLRGAADRRCARRWPSPSDQRLAARWRRRTAPSCSTSTRSSTCASSPTSTASASERPAVPGLRVRANALDLALYRRVRRVARTPQTRGVGAALTRAWASTARSGSCSGRRRRWPTAAAAAAGRARRSCVGAAYVTSTSIKLAVGRRRPGDRGPAAPDGDAHRPLLPVLARDVELRGRARVRRACCRRCRSTRAARRRWACRGSTSACTTRRTSRPAPRSAPCVGSLGR